MSNDHTVLDVAIPRDPATVAQVGATLRHSFRELGLEDEESEEVEGAVVQALRNVSAWRLAPEHEVSLRVSLAGDRLRAEISHSGLARNLFTIIRRLRGWMDLSPAT